MKKGFTLAELLITLTVIGIVSALTIPTIIKTINEKIKLHKIEVFERKIKQGADLLAIQNGIGPYYDTTEEFAQALSKHLKIVKICTPSEMNKCFAYDNVHKYSGTVSRKVTEYKIGEDLGKFDDENNKFGDVIGIVLGDGALMMFTYNLKCPMLDPDTPNQNTTSCISGFYDINGTKKPNRWGKDIVGFNAGYSKAFTPKAITESECRGLKNSLGIKYCNNDKAKQHGQKDYYAGAVKECGGISNMPTKEDSSWMVSQLYTENGAPLIPNSSDVEYFSSPNYYRAVLVNSRSFIQYHPNMIFNQDSAFAKQTGITANTSIFLVPDSDGRLAPYISFNNTIVKNSLDQDRSFGTTKAICKGNF